MAENTKLKLYRLINPSDPYTFYAPDLRIAACVALFLGQGAFGAQGVADDQESSPVMFGWDAFLKEQGIDSAWIESHYAEIATALDSVFIGDERHRVDFDQMLESMPNETTRESWLAERHDRLRSSMNDIGVAAIRLAKQLREKISEAVA
jgi:hypothetical protein